MKRTELVVGTEYVTDKGLRVTVRDIDPGWVVPTEGEPFRDLAQSTRFMSAKGTQSAYLSNTNILVDWTRSDGSVVPLAVQPRALRATWEDYEACSPSLKPMLLKYGKAEFDKRRPQAESDEQGIEALHKRWLDRFLAAGVQAPDLHLSKDGQTVEVEAKSLNSLLTKVGV